MQPEILYEDKDIIAINKPSGFVVHSDGKTDEPNLVDWLLLKYPEIKNVGEPGRNSSGEEVLRSGIVHRLDRDTSGVMLVAKNQKSFEFLKKQFQDRKIKKTYHAIVFGEVTNDKGLIDRPIGRSSQDFRKWSAQRGARGELRDAVTEYKVLFKNKAYSLLEVYPKTGRTHQIRVHFKAINHPLVSDSLYAPNRGNILGISRTALHSKRVVFSNLSGVEIEVLCPYPKDFEFAVSSLQMQ